MRVIASEIVIIVLLVLTNGVFATPASPRLDKILIQPSKSAEANQPSSLNGFIL